MNNEEKLYKLTKASYECKYCNNKMRMIVRGQSEEIYIEDSFLPSHVHYYLLECPSCEKINVLCVVENNECYLGWNELLQEHGWKPFETLYSLSTSESKMSSTNKNISECHISDEVKIGLFSPVRFCEEFIQDKALKNYIMNDLIEITTAYKKGLYKSILILCGCVLEALLDYLINPKLDKNQTNLAQLITKAGEIGLLKSEGKKSAYQIKDYRNLIHYNYWKENQLSTTEETALRSIININIIFQEIESHYNGIAP